MPISRDEFRAGRINVEFHVMAVLRAYQPEVLNFAELMDELWARLRVDVSDDEVWTDSLQLEARGRIELNEIRETTYIAIKQHEG